MYIIELEKEIISKARPRVVSKGKKTWAYTTERTALFEEYVMLKTNAVIRKPLKGGVAVEIMVKKRPPKGWSKKKKLSAIEGKILATVSPDVDNYAKAILDGMNKVAYTDDSNIIDLRVQKKYADEDGAIIRITELEGENAY